MSYYRECPVCGAHLDPGEQCDCERDAQSVTSVDRGCGATERCATPLPACATCGWLGRGGEDCNDPQARRTCACYAPVLLREPICTHESTAHDPALRSGLQMAYLAHLARPQARRLAWLERVIAQA